MDEPTFVPAGATPASVGQVIASLIEAGVIENNARGTLGLSPVGQALVDAYNGSDAGRKAALARHSVPGLYVFGGPKA